MALEIAPATAAGAGRLTPCRSVLDEGPPGASGILRLKFAPFITNTPSTLPTRSTTAIVEGKLRACASATASDITRSTSVTVSDSGAGSVYSLAVLDGGVGEGGRALLPSPLTPRLLLSPPPQDDNMSEQLAMIAVSCLRISTATLVLRWQRRQLTCENQTGDRRWGHAPRRTRGLHWHGCPLLHLV